MKRVWIPAFLLLALLDGDASLAKDEEAGPEVAFQTTYQTGTVLKAHVVRIRGHLGGKGQIELDPNTCTLNEFGDRVACTRMAVRSVPVEFKRAKLVDESGRGRRLYLLHGELPGSPSLFLVVPRKKSGPHRLLVESGDGHRRAITLEPIASPKPAPAGTPCARATYSAWQSGRTVTIRAEGENTEFGYRVFFTRLRLRSWPPQFRLDCERPAGMAGQAMTPFDVKTTFESGKPVDAVVVHDKRGAHRVTVKPAKSR